MGWCWTELFFFREKYFFHIFLNHVWSIGLFFGQVWKIFIKTKAKSFSSSKTWFCLSSDAWTTRVLHLLILSVDVWKSSFDKFPDSLEKWYSFSDFFNQKIGLFNELFHVLFTNRHSSRLSFSKSLKMSLEMYESPGTFVPISMISSIQWKNTYYF